MNIYFAKNNKTRYVKHGFSWQIFCFGPVAYIMRSQIPLAIGAMVGMFGTFVAVGLTVIFAFDTEAEFAQLAGLLAACGLAGYFGNRLSARSYVKNGWKPVEDFPEEWNVPPLIERRKAGQPPA